uniref:S-AdoMet_synt_N domain-containing protein n=1 Tax=Steinernema glaseri TaxID=37863 RepID=A0A1I8A5N5_9BILA
MWYGFDIKTLPRKNNFIPYVRPSSTACCNDSSFLVGLSALPDMAFIETSALSGENVEDAFLKCAKTILVKLDSGEIDVERIGPGIQVHNYQPMQKQKEKNKCIGMGCGMG